MKTAKEFMQGCEHDGSFVPCNEVERLMHEFASQSRWIAVEEIPKIGSMYWVCDKDNHVYLAYYGTTATKYPKWKFKNIIGKKNCLFNIILFQPFVLPKSPQP